MMWSTLLCASSNSKMCTLELEGLVPNVNSSFTIFSLFCICEFVVLGEQSVNLLISPDFQVLGGGLGRPTVLELFCGGQLQLSSLCLPSSLSSLSSYSNILAQFCWRGATRSVIFGVVSSAIESRTGNKSCLKCCFRIQFLFRTSAHQLRLLFDSSFYFIINSLSITSFYS